MHVLQRFRRELAYNAWANRQTLRSLVAARTVPPRALEVMNHIVGAEWLWLRRLGHAAPELQVWPDYSLADCERQFHTLSSAWRDFLDAIREESLDRQIDYVNSKGERWTNSTADVLAHVSLHSSYHRGQVALLLGRAGEIAAYSDYIECVRRGHLLEDWPL